MIIVSLGVAFIQLKSSNNSDLPASISGFNKIKIIVYGNNRAYYSSRNLLRRAHSRLTKDA